MKLIRSSITYRINLPAAALMKDHLAPMRHTPIGENEALRRGFVPPPVRGVERTEHDDLVQTFPGGFVVSLCMDEKIVPRAAVKAEVASRVATWCKLTGENRMPRTDVKVIEEDVRHEFVRRALVKTKVVTAFYHTESRFLFVDGSKKHADLITSLLVQAAGAAKSETIHVSDVKGGLTARLTSHIEGGHGFDETFRLSSSVWMKRERESLTLQLDGVVDGAPQAIREALDGGFRVDALRIEHADTEVGFKLTSDFHLKAIDGLDIEDDYEPDDSLDAFVHGCAVQVTMLVAVLEDLCVMFDYKAPEDGEPAPDDEEVAA